MDIHAHRILILDFGSQYTQLIARRVRECGVYCELHPWDMPEDKLRDFAPNAIILSGGPESVTADQGPRAQDVVFELDVPVLGICYGMQTMAEQMGGTVSSSDHREFGYAEVAITERSALLDGLVDRDGEDGQSLLDVWMSHGDKVTEVPPNFKVIGQSSNSPIAAMAHVEKPWFGLQFHPEVTHTHSGADIIRRFVRDIAGCEGLWTSANIIESAIESVRAQVGDEQVILGLSGGVDSSVVAALLH